MWGLSLSLRILGLWHPDNFDRRLIYLQRLFMSILLATPFFLILFVISNLNQNQDQLKYVKYPLQVLYPWVGAIIFYFLPLLNFICGIQYFKKSSFKFALSLTSSTSETYKLFKQEQNNHVKLFFLVLGFFGVPPSLFFLLAENIPFTPSLFLRLLLIAASLLLCGIVALMVTIFSLLCKLHVINIKYLQENFDINSFMVIGQSLAKSARDWRPCFLLTTFIGLVGCALILEIIFAAKEPLQERALFYLFFVTAFAVLEALYSFSAANVATKYFSLTSKGTTKEQKIAL